jgi:acyl-coenzyme A synthetase/AMP-(fatty) acid ligase
MITSRIYQWAHSQPANPAVIFNDEVLSYAAFANAIESARVFLGGQGLQLHRTAIVLSESLLDAWVFVMALRALGLNTACVQSADRVGAIGRRNVACVVIPEVEVSKFTSTSLERLRRILVPGDLFVKILTSGPPRHPEQTPPFGGHILFTSGTTGTYKRVFLHGHYEDRRNVARAEAYPLTKNMIYHTGNLGLWSSTGFKMPSAVWHTGGCVVIDTRRDPFKNFFRRAIDLSILTPSMLRELVHSRGTGSIRNGCEILVAAGFLPKELAQETARRVTNRVGISYGATELATPALLSRSCAEGDLYWLAPAPNRTVRIVDENGDDCPPGRQGELRIRLMDIDCTSYVNDEETSTKAFRDGYFCPGDMAVSRADGRIRILGRTADVLNMRGQKIAVAPIELAIQHALRVEEVCLLSGLNDAGQEELVVAIQSEAKPPRAALERIARDFPSFERVRFEFFKNFPRTATATRKTQRSALRRLVFPVPRT